MARSALKYRSCYRKIDLAQEELYLQDESAVIQVADLVFQNGGVWGGFDHAKQLQSMMGFFFGDLTSDFACSRCR